MPKGAALHYCAARQLKKKNGGLSQVGLWAALLKSVRGQPRVSSSLTPSALYFLFKKFIIR